MSVILSSKDIYDHPSPCGYPDTGCTCLSRERHGMNYAEARKALVAYGYPGHQARNSLDHAVAEFEGEGVPPLKMLLGGRWHWIKYDGEAGFTFPEVAS